MLISEIKIKEEFFMLSLTDSKIKSVIKGNRGFLKKQMTNISVFKKFKSWMSIHKKAVLNYCAITALVALECWLISFWDGRMPDAFVFIGTMFNSLALLIYVITAFVIFLNENSKDKKAFFFKGKEQEYYEILARNSISLETYQLLCQSLNKEEMLEKAGDKERLTYKDLGVDEDMICFLLSEKKENEQKQIMQKKNEKNKKLKGFIDQMYKEIS